MANRTLAVALWISVWIALSVSIIIVNKQIIFYTPFKFPFLLAEWHMIGATVTARVAMQLLREPNLVKENGSKMLSMQLGLIGVLFGGSLVSGNAALLHLTVPTVQMLKAAGPATMYLIGIAMGSEKLHVLQATQIVLVCTGVAIASYGDLTLVFVGLLLQIASILMDATRCCFLQKVLQHNQIKMSPVVTLAHVAPFSAAALVLPMILLEGPRLVRTYQDWKFAIPLVILSGILAAALNLVVFKLIKLTSALATSLSGVLKEWACILVAMYVYGTPVTQLQWLGYTIAILGLLWYRRARSAAAAPPQLPQHKLQEDDLKLSVKYVKASDLDQSRDNHKGSGNTAHDMPMVLVSSGSSGGKMKS